MTKPNCSADVLIAANRASDGEILRQLEAMDKPSYWDLLSKHLLQASRARERQNTPTSDVEEPEI